MADEISWNFALQLTNGELQDAYSGSNLAADQATALLVRNVQPIGFAAHEALDLADVVTPGVAVFANLDDANYVEVGIDVAAAFHAFLRLDPGEKFLCKLGTSAPYALADTAEVDLFYIIYNT